MLCYDRAVQTSGRVKVGSWAVYTVHTRPVTSVGSADATLFDVSSRVGSGILGFDRIVGQKLCLVPSREYYSTYPPIILVGSDRVAHELGSML